MTSKARGGQRKKSGNAVRLPYSEPVSTDGQSPIFCLRHINKKFDLKESDLTVDAKAAFAERLQTLSSMTWSEIKRSDRHALGTERIPIASMNISLPANFEGEEDLTVFRYSGKKPMAGVRAGATFHILAIEREFGELYSHGS